MDQRKTPLEAATSMAKFMLHRLQLGVSMFAFNKQQIAELVATAKEYSKEVEGTVVDEKTNALHGIFIAMQLFDVELNPYYGMRENFGYTQVLGFFETTKINWVTAIREFASFYPKEMDLPEGYTYRIEEGKEPNVDDWIAKLPGHLTAVTDIKRFVGDDMGISAESQERMKSMKHLDFGNIGFKPELSMAIPLQKDGKPWVGEVHPLPDTGYIRLQNPNAAQIDEAIRDMMSQVLNPETRSPKAMVNSMRLTDVTLLEPGFDFRKQLICMAVWVQNIDVLHGGHLVLENFLHNDKAIVSFPLPRFENASKIIDEVRARGYVHIAITRSPNPISTMFKDQWHYHIDGQFAAVNNDVAANVAASAITSHAILSV